MEGLGFLPLGGPGAFAVVCSSFSAKLRMTDGAATSVSFADSAGSEDSMDAAEDATDRVPHDENRDGPLPAARQDHLRRGPPPPEPVNRPNCAPAPAGSPREHAETKAAPEQKLTPARRPRPPTPSASGTSSTDDSDDDTGDDNGAASGADDEGSPAGWWSDTSCILEGDELAEAADYFVNLFRRQLREAQEELSSRSLAAKVGALRRRLATTSRPDMQGLSTQRLQGIYLREWTQYEFRSTHTYHTGRSLDEDAA